jgi:hypothetical protein
VTSIRDPNLMSAEERDREVASLFALAFLRIRTRSALGQSPTSGSPESRESVPNGLELSGETRLSVTTG